MKKRIFADLHNHTRASDGEFSAGELIREAVNKGIDVVGVTDHDTLEGLEAAVIEGEKNGVRVVPGVEISVRFNRAFFTGTLHVLAYFSRDRLDDGEFLRGVQDLLSKGRGDGLIRARVDKINRIFGPDGQNPKLPRDLTFENITVFSANASRRHFALALNQMGITERDQVNSIIGNDSPAYLPSGVELETVASFLKSAPVVGVLAHPAAGSFPGEGHYREVLPPWETVQALLPELLSANVQGLEVFYPGHSREYVELLLALAEEHNLLVTGGSDCHDAVERPFGVCGIPFERFSLLEKAIERVNTG